MGKKAATVPETVVSRVNEVRERRGWSLSELSRRVAALGHSMDPSALMRLERGERRVTVEDLLALALALDVAPVHLLVPLDNDARVRLSAKVVADAGPVRQWVRGLPAQSPIPGVDYDHYGRETPGARWEQRTGFHERMNLLLIEMDDAADDEERLAEIQRQHAGLLANRMRAERGHVKDWSY